MKTNDTMAIAAAAVGLAASLSPARGNAPAPAAPDH